MKKTLKAAAITAALTAGILAPIAARAESWFHFESGIGLAAASDMGDGTWVQYGMQHHEKLLSPAFELGITGDLLQTQPFALAYHVDYVNLGRISADTMAVADSQYDATTHQVIGGAANNPTNVASFHGSGSTQGISLTLQPTYTWRNVRFGIEGGAFVFRPTWTEQVTPYQSTTFSASHNPQTQVSWIAGMSVEYQNFGLSYRYYADRSSWNPFPGIVNKTHVLMLTYKY